MDKIRSFYAKYNKKGDEYSEAEFLELMLNYPQSMCALGCLEICLWVFWLVSFGFCCLFFLVDWGFLSEN